MNTYQTLELSNGETIKLTFNLKKFYMLKSKNKDLYTDVNKAIMRGSEEIIDMVKVIYAGYLCALESGTEKMSFDDFLDVVPQDIGLLATLATSLTTAKKK